MLLLMLLVVVALVPIYYALRYLWELVPAASPATTRTRCVFITGCDSGFGRLLALKLATQGIPALSGCLTQKCVEEIEEVSKGLPQPVEAIQVDVTNVESVEKAARWVEGRLGEGRVLWALVNNAGIFSCYGPDAWSDMSDYQRSVDVNLFGAIRSTHVCQWGPVYGWWGYGWKEFLNLVSWIF